MKKILLISYYWPPGGGSGVQRWMYFCKYLSEFGIHPIVITVEEKKASYRYTDESLSEMVKDVEVYKTNTLEPLKLYSRMVSGNENSAIPIGFAGETKPGFLQTVSRAIRGNLFIPDARKGWVKYAVNKAKEILSREKIDLVITNGPPHSSHFVGARLKKEFGIKWMADFRDPWTDLHYNKFLYRTKWALKKDARLERKILNDADIILTMGPGMKKHLVQKGSISPDKVLYVYNGYDENDFKDVDFSTDPDHFTISHIGMLSDSQPITAFLLALKTFFEKKHPICKSLKLRLIGNVSPIILAEVRAIVPELLLEHQGYVKRKVAISYMLSSDLLFNSLAEMENSELLISGKLMEYIAAGKPILCLGNPRGDAANLLKEFEYSAVFDRKDVELIVSFLETVFEKWMNKTTFAGEAARYKQYSRYETTRQLADALKKIMEC
jgi:glycosyltransferase involved in cell wall biosynthesis